MGVVKKSGYKVSSAQVAQIYMSNEGREICERILKNEPKLLNAIKRSIQKMQFL